MKLRSAVASTVAALACGTVWAGSVEIPVQVGGAYSVPITSLKESRFRSTAQQQFDFSCGSAALSTLLTHHYGMAVTEQVVFESMYNHGNQQKIRQHGFSMLDMKRYLESRGFQADGFEAPLDKLAEAGVPAIVLINENGYNHFVVVKGLRDGRVLFGDPAGGTRAVAKAHFEALWTNKILFVIANEQQRARFNDPSEWRVAQRAPLDSGIYRESLNNIVLPRLGPADF